MLTGRKLLLADDSLTIQKVVSLTFGDEEMEVTTVGGGAEALEHLGESLPDIVLADVFMPEPNGYALCERIKRDERTRHIPVVLLVGTFEPFNEAEARRVGADEVLTKPFQSIRDLVNKVGGLLGGQPDEKRPDATTDARRDEETTRDLSPFAADARAADPTAEAPAASTAATPTATDAFADFDMDDATIQTTPAAAFDAQHERTPAPDFSEIKEEEQFSDRAETDEAFVLGDDDDAILSTDDAPAPEVHAAAVTAATSHVAAPSAAPVADTTFEAHASRAAEADDALLDIGDIAPPRAASDDADDFILDIGDEDSFTSHAAFTPDAASLAPDAAADVATAETDLLFAEHAPATSAPQAYTMSRPFTEPEVSAGPLEFEDEETAVSEAEMSAFHASPATTEAEAAPYAQAAHEEMEALEILDAPPLLFANEPVQDEQETTEFEGREEISRAYAWDGDPAAASALAHAGGGVAPYESTSESQLAESEAAGESMATVAPLPSAAPVADSHVAASASSRAAAETDQTATAEAGQTTTETGQAASHASSSSLSPEMLDEVVRRVVAQMSEQVVREIAWEVVPELAERLVKQRLEEERARTPQ